MNKTSGKENHFILFQKCSKKRKANHNLSFSSTPHLQSASFNKVLSPKRGNKNNVFIKLYRQWTFENSVHTVFFSRVCVTTIENRTLPFSYSVPIPDGFLIHVGSSQLFSSLTHLSKPGIDNSKRDKSRKILGSRLPFSWEAVPLNLWGLLRSILDPFLAFMKRPRFMRVLLSNVRKRICIIILTYIHSGHVFMYCNLQFQIRPASLDAIPSLKIFPCRWVNQSVSLIIKLNAWFAKKKRN